MKSERHEIDWRIVDIAQGPNLRVTTFKGYFVNGFKFHTLEYGINKQTMNSGICIKKAATIILNMIILAC